MIQNETIVGFLAGGEEKEKGKKSGFSLDEGNFRAEAGHMADHGSHTSGGLVNLFAWHNGAAINLALLGWLPLAMSIRFSPTGNGYIACPTPCPVPRTDFPSESSVPGESSARQRGCSDHLQGVFI